MLYNLRTHFFIPDDARRLSKTSYSDTLSSYICSLLHRMQDHDSTMSILFDKK